MSPNQQPLVSLVMPAKNASSTIVEAIESIQAQTFRDWELVVVDDQSSDDTRDIALDLALGDERIRVIQTPPDRSGSVAFARNAGLREARGEYVTFPDADDVALPSRLDLTVAAMRETGANVGFADFRRFSVDGEADRGHLASLDFVPRAAAFMKSAGAGRFTTADGFVGFMLSDMIALSPQTTIMSCALIGDLTCDESLIGGEDLDFFYRLLALPTARAVFHGDVVTRMRTHANSITSTRALRCQADACVVRLSALSRLSPSLAPAQRRRAHEAVGLWLFELGWAYRQIGDTASARDAYRSSLSAYPSLRVFLAYLKTLAPVRTRIAAGT